MTIKLKVPQQTYIITKQKNLNNYACKLFFNIMNIVNHFSTVLRRILYNSKNHIILNVYFFVSQKKMFSFSNLSFSERFKTIKYM